MFRFTKIIGALVGAPGNLGKEDMVQEITISLIILLEDRGLYRV